MSFRLKLAAITSATLLGVGLAAVGAATPAFAINNVTFCVYNSNNQLACAYASGGWVDMGSSEPLWDWPTSGTAQISYHGSGASGCMTRDASAGNRIDLKACQGLASQEWTAHYISGEYGGYWFQNPASGLCLNDHWQAGQLDAASCANVGNNDNELFSQA